MNLTEDKLTAFHGFKIILISIFKWIKKFLRTLSASSLIIIYMLSLFECITHSSSLSIEEIKLIAIVSWISHVSQGGQHYLKIWKFLGKKTSLNSLKNRIFWYFSWKFMELFGFNHPFIILCMFLYISNLAS